MNVGLTVSNLIVRIEGRNIVDNVSLMARPGEVTGLIGPNGAGKSTLMRAILGLVARNAGSVTYNQRDLLALPRRRRAQFTAFAEQTANTDALLSVRDVVLLGRIPFQPAWQLQATASDQQIVNAVLIDIGLTDLADQAYHTLSGGEQQRVQIARALAQQPSLLVLDEPTNHLDIHAQLSSLDLMRRKARSGATILVALHDLNHAASFCDHIIVLHHGKTIISGSPWTVLTPALLFEIYGVHASLLQHPQTGRPLIAYASPEQAGTLS